MATASEIIAQAYREGNFVAIGENPTAEEIAEAVPRLRSLVDSLFGHEIGEQYRDWYVPSELATSVPLRSPLSPTGNLTTTASESWKFPPANARLLVKTSAAQTIYMPANPSDGARFQLLNIGSVGALIVTLDGNGHLIESAVSLADTLTNLHARKWFYRADLGDWVRLVSLADETSTMPLPTEFDEYFICGLAMRLSTRFQRPVDEATASRFGDIRKRLKARYKQSEGMPASYGQLQSTVHQATTWDL